MTNNTKKPENAERNTEGMKNQNRRRPQRQGAANKPQQSVVTENKNTDAKTVAKKPNQLKNTNQIKNDTKQKNENKPKNENKKPFIKGKGGKGKKGKNAPKLQIIPLGGLNEVGKNMTAFKYEEEIIIVDCGLAFPDADMLGVDLVLPDFTFVEANKSKIKALFITHGHEDHIGGVAYLLKTHNLPVYGTRLTIGLIEGKLKEHGLSKSSKLNVIEAGSTTKVGSFNLEAIRVNHSIPDAVSYAIHTPAGVVVHMGDFKVDYTPIEGGMIDLARFGELGRRGVLALMSDSTNAERPGSTMSERKVGENLSALFERAEKQRVIVATFASNIHRVQQIINAAVKQRRKVALSGRSMLNVVEKGMELGYIKIPKNTIIDISEISRFRKDQLCIITTGSQGEPLSALARMSTSDHRQVNIIPGDFIIISATPIPGNEKTVSKLVNDLMKLGADVIYERMYEIHVSGHASQDELKLLMSLTKPKYFIPVHGEHKHLRKHATLATEMGIPDKNIIIADIGSVIEVSADKAGVVGSVPAGRVFVDGLGVGDVGSVVLRDRKHLGTDGIFLVVATIAKEGGYLLSGPEIHSRGFVYVRESEELMQSARKTALSIISELENKKFRDFNEVRGKLRDSLSNLIYQRTKRSPMIFPIIMEV